MVTITPTGTTYTVHWHDPDGRPRSRECPSYATAGLLKRDIERATAHGQPWSPRPAQPVPDLRILLNHYLASLQTTHRPTTIIRHARALDLFTTWLESRASSSFLGPDLLNRDTLTEWHESLRHTGRHGRDRKSSTRRKLVEVVQSAWDDIDLVRGTLTIRPELGKTRTSSRAAPSPCRRTCSMYSAPGISPRTG